MKRLVLKFLHVGIQAQDDFFLRTLKIVVNLLLYNAIFMMLLAIGLGIFLEGNQKVLYLLLSFPFYGLVFYLNYIGKTAMGFTMMFSVGTLTLSFASLQSGEDSYTHIFFAAIVICISVLYRKGIYRRYYIANIAFTSICFAFVMLSYHYGWFSWLEDSQNLPEYDRTLNIIFLFLSVVIFSLVLVISTGRQHDRLYQMNRQNELLLAELNHRVKNNLAIITSLIRLKRGELEEQDGEVLLDLESRIKAIALMHDNMFSRNNQQEVKLDEFLNTLIESICRTYEHGKTLRIVQQVPALELSFNQTLPFSMIINELVINSLKHAFHHQDQPEIHVQCRVSNGVFYLDYGDNGMGLPVNGEFKKGLGRELIESLAEQLDATIEEQYTPSYGFKLSFTLT